MKTLTMETVLKSVKEYFLMTVGMMLYSFGWIGCILPVKERAAVRRAFRSWCAARSGRSAWTSRSVRWSSC